MLVEQRRVPQVVSVVQEVVIHCSSLAAEYYVLVQISIDTVAGRHRRCEYGPRKG